MDRLSMCLSVIIVGSWLWYGLCGPAANSADVVAFPSQFNGRNKEEQEVYYDEYFPNYFVFHSRSVSQVQ